MGKSLTAEEYALHFGAAYPGGIFWFRAYGDDGATPLPESEERESLRTSEFQRMGERLGLWLDGLRPEQFDNALSYEIKRRGKNCLWIVDDVPAGVPVNELRRWVGPAGVTRTLITTRSREYSSLARAVDLSGLTEAEAYQLLTSRREPRGEKERSEAGLLAGDLGRHPLALDVTASALVSYAEAEPYAKFRAELRSDAGDSLELAKELAEALPNGHEASISKTMLRSIRNLGEEAQDFLRLASILPPAPISGSLVQSVFRIADGVGLDTAAWRQRHAFHEVTMASLAEVAGPGQEARTAHTLVSRTVRFRERRAGERTAQLRAAAVEALQSEFLSVRQSGMRNSMFEFDLEHARHIAGDPKTIPEASLICTLTGIVFWLAWSLNLQQKAVELYERTLGPEHPTTLESINGLVLCLHATGNIAGACKLQGELLSVQVKTLGPESHQALASMNNLAGLRAQMGDLAGAKKLHEDLIAIRLRLLGPDHLETITSMNNLAVILQVEGKLVEARAVLERVTEVRRRVLGHEHPDTLLSLNNFASVLDRQGELMAARKLKEETLDIRRRVLGPEHPSTLTSVENLAASLLTAGDLHGARKMQEELLATRRRVLGPEHPLTLHSTEILSITLGRLGDFPEAKKLADELLVARRRTFGPDDPRTLAAMDRVAEICCSARRFEEGCAILSEVLERRRSVLGSEHTTTLGTMNNLAVALALKGDLVRSSSMHEEALRVQRRLLGPRHPDTIASMKNLAGVLYEMRRMSEYRDLLKQMVEALPEGP